LNELDFGVLEERKEKACSSIESNQAWLVWAE